jgi:hypothetical protein
VIPVISLMVQPEQALAYTTVVKPVNREKQQKCHLLLIKLSQQENCSSPIELETLYPTKKDLVVRHHVGNNSEGEKWCTK